MLLAPAVAIALMIVVVAVSFWAMREQRLAQEELANRYLAARAMVHAVGGQVATTRGEIYRLFALLGSYDAKRIDQERVGLRNQLLAIGTTLSRTDLVQSEDESKLTAQSVAEIGKYAKKADDAIDMATGDVNIGVAAMMSADEQYGAVVRAINEIGSAVDADADQVAERTERTAQASQWLIGAALIVAIVAALSVAIVSARATVGQLRAASEIAGRLADGDLGARFAIASRDELGDLSRSLDRMGEAFAPRRSPRATRI